MLCDRDLPLNSFHVDSSRKDKLRIYCIPCAKIKRVNYRDTANRATVIREKRDRDAMNDRWWRKKVRYHRWNGTLDLDFVQVKAIFDKQDKRCLYCKIILIGENLCIEHFYPQRKDKIVIACNDCNRLKWRRSGDEFIEFLKEYISRFS
jgi:RNase P subunit RPR2